MTNKISFWALLILCILAHTTVSAQPPCSHKFNSFMFHKNINDYTLIDTQGPTVTTSNPCDTANISIVGAVTAKPYCNGETGSVVVEATGGTGGYRYLIDWVQFTTNNFYGPTSRNNLSPGSYEFRAVDSLGCLSDSIILTIEKQSNFSVSLDSSSSPGSICTTIQNSSLVNNSFTYTWVSGETTSCLAVDRVGLYQATVIDSYGCEQESDMIWILQVNTDKIENENLSVNIYPNPCSSHANLNVENSQNDYTVTLHNALGKQLHQSSNTKTIDTSQLPQGIYFVTVSYKNNHFTQKITKI